MKPTPKQIESFGLQITGSTYVVGDLLSHIRLYREQCPIGLERDPLKILAGHQRGLCRAGIPPVDLTYSFKDEYFLASFGRGRSYVVLQGAGVYCEGVIESPVFHVVRFFPKYDRAVLRETESKTSSFFVKRLFYLVEREHRLEYLAYTEHNY